MTSPNPNNIHPIPNIDWVSYIKPTITRSNIIVGEFSYFSDNHFEDQVMHHYDFYQDKLIIGKFCQIAKGVRFIMNGANHQMNAVTTFPFYIFEGWEQKVPPLETMTNKGDIVIGNDVWIGENVTIMPGTHIGNGVIIGTNSTVAQNVSDYHIVVGNSAKPVRKRFDDEMIEILQRLQWWDLPISTIQELIPTLTNSNLSFVKEELNKFIENNSKK